MSNARLTVVRMLTPPSRSQYSAGADMHALGGLPNMLLDVMPIDLALAASERWRLGAP